MLRVHQMLVENDHSMYRKPLGSPEFNGLLDTMGIRFVDNPAHADVIFADVRCIQLEQMPHTPHVIMELCGYGTVIGGPTQHAKDEVGYAPTPVRELVKLDNVKACIKQAYYRRLADHNKPLFEMAVAGQLVYDATPVFERPRITDSFYRHQEPITQAELDKFVAVCNHPWHPYSVAARKSFDDFPVVSRTLDATFVANGGVYTTWFTRYHRWKCVEAMRKLPPQILTCNGISDELSWDRKKLKWPEMRMHFQLLRMSRMGISPWGYNELCVRDFEIATAGCVLIKPVADMLVTWPDVFDSPATVTCKPDFSDLQTRIEYVRDNWDYFRIHAEMRANEMAKTLRSPHTLAKRYAEILYKAADRSPVWSLPTVKPTRRIYDRPMLSVGMTCMPSHPVRLEYLKTALQSYRDNLISPYDYEFVLSVEPVEDKDLLNEAISIGQDFGATIVMHDQIRGYGPHTAFLTYQMIGAVKLVTQDDTVLPEKLDLSPYFDLIANDPKVAMISLGWLTKQQVIDEEGTPEAFRHLVGKISTETLYYYSDGIHLRTPLLAEAVGLYHPGWDRSDEWTFNCKCKEAAEQGRFHFYASRINYRKHIGYWSIVQTDQPWHLSNYVLPIPSSSSSSDSSSKSQSSSEIASELK